MKLINKPAFLILTVASFLTLPSIANAVCPVTFAQLDTALEASVAASGGPSNGGLDNHMWATVVDADGTVCAVARSGPNFDSQWLGSRVISAQKANTANAFGLDGLAISTANLWAATQPGGSLFGLQFSNPVDTGVAYDGTATDWGTISDALVGDRIGGVNVFGGGLALYDDQNDKVGAVGVSGDTSCADHNIAWRVRDELGLDYVTAGPGGIFGGTVGDNIIYDVTGNHGNFASKSGFGHPSCGFNEEAVNDEIVDTLPLGDGDSTP